MKIPFSPPYVDDDVKREVLDTLSSGWITTGPKVLELEKLVGEQAGVRHVACCNSATSGLMLVLHWFGVTRGDEVIVPAYTYAATALAVMHLGAKPVMVDCGEDFNMNPDHLLGKITPRTKAIIPVDLAGWPCDYKRIYEIAVDPDVRKKFQPGNENQKKLGRILVLADAAHSIGATYGGKPAAGWSDFSVFSFHAVKNVTTAEGGAICINLPPEAFDLQDVYRTLKLWSLNGQTRDALSKVNGGNWRYDIVYPGFKMNMPDICAAVGLAQLRKYESFILPERKRIFQTYAGAFQDNPWAIIPPFQDELRCSSCHVFPLRIRNISEAQRDRIIEKIGEKGVSVNVHFQPLPLLSVFKERGYKIEDYPVAYRNYASEISLPVYPDLTPDALAYVVQAVREAYNEVVL